MKMLTGRGSLDRPPGAREAALVRRWRRFHEGAPAALYLLLRAVVLLAVGVGVGYLLSKVAAHDAFGRADASGDRWFAAHRSRDWNSATQWIMDLAETPTVTALAVLTVAVTALVWRRWREPMLVAVAVTGEVLIFLGITWLVDRHRPPVSHLDTAPPTSSFPSGHTAAAVCI